MIAFATIWFLSVLAWKLIDNFKRWEKFKPVDHIGQWWLVVGWQVPALIVFASRLDLPIWQQFTLSGAMMGFVFMGLFNGIYNVIRRRSLLKRDYHIKPGYLKWFYLAKNNSKEKSLLDQVWLWLPKWVYFIVMTVVPILLILVYGLNLIN